MAPLSDADTIEHTAIAELQLQSAQAEVLHRAATYVEPVYQYLLSIRHNHSFRVKENRRYTYTQESRGWIRRALRFGVAAATNTY
jgi:hypothetical protein